MNKRVKEMGTLRRDLETIKNKHKWKSKTYKIISKIFLVEINNILDINKKISEIKETEI